MQAPKCIRVDILDEFLEKMSFSKHSKIITFAKFNLN